VIDDAGPNTAVEAMNGSRAAYASGIRGRNELIASFHDFRNRASSFRYETRRGRTTSLALSLASAAALSAANYCRLSVRFDFVVRLAWVYRYSKFIQ
jgi:hypothetical protein